MNSFWHSAHYGVTPRLLVGNRGKCSLHTHISTFLWARQLFNSTYLLQRTELRLLAAVSTRSSPYSEVNIWSALRSRLAICAGSNKRTCSDLRVKLRRELPSMHQASGPRQTRSSNSPKSVKHILNSPRASPCLAFLLIALLVPACTGARRWCSPQTHNLPTSI